MGVHFRGRKGEVDQMGPLSIPTPRRDSGNTGPGQGGDTEEERANVVAPLAEERKTA